MHNKSVQKRISKSRGQGMMEYIIIVAMIAVAAIGVYSMFGKTIRDQTAGMANEVAGKSASAIQGKAAAAAGVAASRADDTKGMADYHKENDAGT